jgi:hypothetical protein
MRRLPVACRLGELPVLQLIALANEAFSKPTGRATRRWQDHAHFLGIAARPMPRVLVDRARTRACQNRRGDAAYVTVTDAMAIARQPP